MVMVIIMLNGVEHNASECRKHSAVHGAVPTSTQHLSAPAPATKNMIGM